MASGNVDVVDELSTVGPETDCVTVGSGSVDVVDGSFMVGREIGLVAVHAANPSNAATTASFEVRVRAVCTGRR